MYRAKTSMILHKNMSGILEFEVKGKAGDEIHLYPEKLAKKW